MSALLFTIEDILTGIEAKVLKFKASSWIEFGYSIELSWDGELLEIHAYNGEEDVETYTKALMNKLERLIAS